MDARGPPSLHSVTKRGGCAYKTLASTMPAGPPCQGQLSAAGIARRVHLAGASSESRAVAHVAFRSSVPRTGCRSWRCELDMAIKPDVANGTFMSRDARCVTARAAKASSKPKGATCIRCYGGQLFNIGAGMAGRCTAAAFVKSNMPIAYEEKVYSWARRPCRSRRGGMLGSALRISRNPNA